MKLDFPVGLVLDQVDSVGEHFLMAFESVEVFEVHEGTAQEELAALQEGKRIVVVVPDDAQSDSRIGVTAYYDATKYEANQIVLPIVSQILDEMERQITARPRIFTIKSQPVQRERLRQIDFLLPGILSMALMQLGLFGSLRLVNLRERKTLKSLGATPVNRCSFIASEILVRLGMSLLQALVIVIIGHLAFDVTVVGSWLQVIGMVLIGAGMFVSLGYLIASFAKTEEAGSAVIQLVQFPMMFLSGIFFPVTMMPMFMRPVVNAVPLTYLGDALRQIMIGYPGDYALITDIIVLAGWFVVTFVLTIRFWRWE